MYTDKSQPLTDETSLQADASASTPKKGGRRSVRRYLVHLLAVLGVLFVILASILAYSIWRDGHLPIPETATIESTLGETFGRYSEEHKGWLYVTDAKRSYVMRVVQQASIDNKKEGDGLYFVASGTPLDDKPGTVYGVFYLYKDAKSGELRQVASLYLSEANQPLTPEAVHFEALSHQVWAWVIKERAGTENQVESEYVTNVVLAPHDGEIKELARFNALQRVTPTGGCAKADEAYKQWLREREEKQSAAAVAAASAASDVNDETEGNEDETEYDEPSRCDDMKWTYKTNPPKDGVLTPLLITRTGISQGVAQPDKTWKVMFDAKSFVYLMPDPLK